jgi:autotransporter-associated beta strand protein/probable HAF family extracellular repeat protein
LLETSLFEATIKPRVRIAPASGARHSRAARRRLLLASSSLAALAAMLPSAGYAQSFQGLGFIGTPAESVANGVNANGSVVVGTAEVSGTSQAFLWTASGGMVGLGTGPGANSSSASGVSDDGSVIAGSMSAGNIQAMRWTAATGFVGLGFLGSGTVSGVGGISADGSVISGTSTTTISGGDEAFRWTAATGMVGLGFLPGRSASGAAGMSTDGSVIVGSSSLFAAGDPHGQEAFRWTQTSGMTGLGRLPGDDISSALRVTGDGSTVVGTSLHISPSFLLISGQAYRWAQATGMIGLGFLPGDNFSSAFGVSRDGAVVVGNSVLIAGGHDAHPERGFLWDQVFGMQDLRQVLVTQYGLNVAGWELTVPTAVSADGRTIVGFGIDPNGRTQAFTVSGLLVNRLVNGPYTVAAGLNDKIGMLGGSGVVQIGAGGSLSIAGNNTSSDPVNFPNSVFTGTIAGAGDLIKAGSGLWLFGGSFQSTGNLFIDNGSLRLAAANAFINTVPVRMGPTAVFDLAGFNTAIGSLSGGGTIALGSGTLTVGAANTNTGFAGVIAGSGGLNKTGAGTLLLTETSTYTGATNVNGGTLSVSGSIASSALTTVNAGGALGGTGSVGNTTIASGGAFAPGNGTPGSSMTVNGNLALQSGALYLVQLNPTTSTFANVTGTATLNGSAGATFLAGNYISKRYTILTAAGGVSGSFSSLNASGIPAGFTASLSYDAHDVFLNLNFFTPPILLNANQQNVENALINFFNRTGGIPMAFATLTPAGLTQVSGETATGAQQTTFNAMNQFMDVMTDPFIAGRGDAVTAGAGAPQFAEEGDATNAYASNGKARSKSGRDAYAAVYRKAPVLADPFTQRWSVWSAGYGGSQTTDGNAVLGSNNTRSSIGGVAVGADYRFSPNTLAGFAIAGGGTNFSINGLGSGRSDLFQAGAFMRHTVGPAYLSTALAYGWQDITTDRTVTVAGADLLRANFNANAYSGRVEGGYRFVTPWIGGAGITPYAAGQFTTFDLPAYTEQAIAGANTFALAYASKSATDTRSELGVRTDKSFAMPNGIFTLRGRAAWAHDFNPDRNISATFQTLPGASFIVNGAAQASDAALVTGSAEMKWLNGFSLAATFEGEFSSVTRSYAGKGVARYAW